MAVPVQPHPGEGAVAVNQVALPSYASILGVRFKTTIKRSRTDHRLEEKDGYPAVFFAPRDVDRAKEFMNNAIILKFSIGKKPSLGDVRSTINRDWGISGDYTLGIIDHRHVLMKVQAEEEVVKVLTREKNHIRGAYFQASRWAIDFDPRKDTPMASMWVDLPGLKLHHYHPDVLTTIAEAIGGKFLKADDETLCQTRATHARICVEVDLMKQMPDFCFIADPSREGYWQRIRYPGKTPLFCCFCYRKGHEVNQCRIKGEMLAKRGSESMKNMNVASDKLPSKLSKQKCVAKSTNHAQLLVNGNAKQVGVAANVGVSNTEEQKEYTVDSRDFCSKAGAAAKGVGSEVNADLGGEKVHVVKNNVNLVSKSGQLDISGDGKMLNSVSSNTRRKEEDVQWRKEIQNGTREFFTVNNVSNIATSINRFNLLLDEDECGNSLKLQSEENTQGESSVKVIENLVEEGEFIPGNEGRNINDDQVFEMTVREELHLLPREKLDIILNVINKEFPRPEVNLTLKTPEMHTEGNSDSNAADLHLDVEASVNKVNDAEVVPCSFEILGNAINHPFELVVDIGNLEKIVPKAPLDVEEDEKEVISDFEEEPTPKPVTATKAKKKKNFCVKTRSQVTSTSPRYKSR